MNFIKKLSEALDAPDLPDEDKWTEDHEFAMSTESVAGYIINFLDGRKGSLPQTLYDADGYAKPFHIKNALWGADHSIIVTFSDTDDGFEYNYKISIENV